MASIDLLEELKLKDFYPQKLSFSEAIKLTGKSQNGCPKQYGLEIVRKLLMFDSTAVISVTAEINERINNTCNTETETRVQSVSDGVRSQRKSSVRPSRRSDNAVQSERKLHPMDSLVAVMNCCDNFLRQVLVEKMFANKLSVPILLPDVRNGSYTLLLFALRSLFPEVKDQIRDGSTSLIDTLVDIKHPVVTFIRLSKLHRSKSKLVNELLGFNSFNTFIHRECPNGSAKRSESNGSIEAAWFQSEKATEEEFNCRFFTVLNLRGDATDYPRQTQFLCQSSTLVVFMVDSFESFKELYENVLKDIKVSQKNIIVCYISLVSPDKIDDKYFDFMDDLSERGIISAVEYDWKDIEKKNDFELTNDLRKTISNFFTPEHKYSDRMPTYTSIMQRGMNFGFSLDEDKLDYKLQKASADKFIDLVLKQSPDCKSLLLPLQGQPWEKFGQLEREQRAKLTNENQVEHFIAEKETEKRKQRQIQCRSLIQRNEIAQTFSFNFIGLQDRALSYYLNSCKMKLDARSRVIVANLLENYKEKKGNQSHLPNDGGPEVKLSKLELKIANSAIGLEHFLREHGQMYEAVISEKDRMKEELKNAPLKPDVIRNFPTIVARLLLMGQPLELMDGDVSNVPITWLKAVLNQVRINTNNAKVFVLSIIGVQSSGKSTLLNALFGLQFPVSAGRCTKGIYCHLVPVDRVSLNSEFDYVLVVDTEGLGSSQFTEKSTFRDNELATFAIGVADATIINMKGENWAEMKDILQIVAHGLIRVRKTKEELKLMPRCMFVHQNVPAVDAEERNRLGQAKQLMLLDKAIKEAGSKEGFTEITKFDDVIKYDPDLHSWYFPDLWNGRPPKARTSQDYTGKANELRQYLMEVMKANPSKLTIESFVFRMSDLWNAMLHNNFVLCFRNTQEILAGTSLNDRISHEVDNFKILNKLEQTKIRESISSYISIELFRAEKEQILREVNGAVEKNFTNMKASLQGVVNATDICEALKQQHEVSLRVIKEGELLRISNEMAKDISVHMKKLEYHNEKRVKGLKTMLAELEKRSEEVEKDKLSEAAAKEFEKSWEQLVEDNKKLVDERKKLVESKIEVTIRGSIKKLDREDKLQLGTFVWSELFKTPLTVEMPKVAEKDIVQSHKRLVLDFVFSKSCVNKANTVFYKAYEKWELEFQNQTGLEFYASHLEQVMFDVGRLLRLSKKEEFHAPETDEICSSLPAGYTFTPEYIIRFIKFACHYTWNRSLENSKIFISMTNPLDDIDERRQRSISNFRLISAEANIDAVSKQIFDYAKRYFVRNLGELIKTEVSNEHSKYPTFKTKRAFLKTILTDLGQKTIVDEKEELEKQKIFKQFMLYVDLGESKPSEDFFLETILKLLKEMLIKESASQTDFQKIIENSVRKVVENAKNALRVAETMCKGDAIKYVRIFKQYMYLINRSTLEILYFLLFKNSMTLTSELDFRINTLDGFTDAVLQKIDSLYADFFTKANSSFETLVCEGNRAAIRTVFDKIMGCREKCPFCSAPCSQSLQHHAGDHRANHYPMGVGGTVERWSLFTNTLETHDAYKEEERDSIKLALFTCQAMVDTRIHIRTKATVETYMGYFNYFYTKNYKKIEESKDWDIPYNRNHNASLFWKWFMAKFIEQIAKHYKALCPEIPKEWINASWEDLEKSLD